MFELTDSELQDLRSKISSTNVSAMNRSTTKVFTERGLYMLATVLKGDAQLNADISPSPLALNPYFRTHSIGNSPIEFWGDQLEPRAKGSDDERLATL